MTADSGSVVHLVSEILSLTSGNGDKLADEVGVSYASLYAWSRGRRRPTARNLRALASVARRRARRLSALADRLGALEEGRTDGEALEPRQASGADVRRSQPIIDEARVSAPGPELQPSRAADRPAQDQRA